MRHQKYERPVMKFPKHQPDGNFELSDLGESGRSWLIILFFIERDIHMLWSERKHFNQFSLLWSLCKKKNSCATLVWLCTLAYSSGFYSFIFSFRWAAVQDMEVVHDKSRAADGNLLWSRLCWYCFCCSSQLCCWESLCIKACCAQSWEEFAFGLSLQRD